MLQGKKGNNTIIYILWALILVSFTSCSKALYKDYPKRSFDKYTPAELPDYANLSHWAAHPDKRDKADRVPDADLFKNRQAESKVDVFFVHPTIYTGKKGQNQWNADVEDEVVNKETDESTILYQASIFNGSGRVFAPRYRQAHLHAYYAKDSISGQKALDLAYEDVKAAFEYYMTYHNNDRPIIIAAHSQGTTHAGRLLKAFFDGQELQKKLVVAYVVGMQAPKSYFTNIPPCENKKQTGCFCSWRTFGKGFYPDDFEEQAPDLICTNPLNWRIDSTYADYAMNKGGVLWKFDKVIPKVVDAQVHQGLLWVGTPKVTGAKLVKNKDYHAGDFNLFYVNVRQNAQHRVASYFENKPEEIISGE